MSSLTLRAYEVAQDEAAVYALWQRLLGGTWPISRAVFHKTTVGNSVYRTDDHAVAVTGNDQIVGFVATQMRALPDVAASDQSPGELMVMLVNPDYQRQGIGTALLDRGLAVLKGRGASQVQVGAGGISYFWPGVPTNLPGAWPFFAASGWVETWTAIDMTLSLDAYATPPDIYARVRLPNVAITQAEARDIPDLLSFEARHFPHWAAYYDLTVAEGAHRDILFARDTMIGEILGATLALDFREPGERHGFRWPQLLGESTGGIGVLGVAEAWRENGIGLALAARATELLQARGLTTSYVGYTWLEDWYGKLGYRVWRDYTMSAISL